MKKAIINANEKYMKRSLDKPETLIKQLPFYFNFFVVAFYLFYPQIRMYKLLSVSLDKY